MPFILTKWFLYELGQERQVTSILLIVRYFTFPKVFSFVTIPVRVTRVLSFNFSKSF